MKKKKDAKPIKKLIRHKLALVHSLLYLVGAYFLLGSPIELFNVVALVFIPLGVIEFIRAFAWEVENEL